MTPKLGWIFAGLRPSGKIEARFRQLPSPRGSPNGGRGADLAIFAGIWTHSSHRLPLTHDHRASYPTAEWIARQLTEAFPWNEAPHYLIRDRDRIYGAVVIRRLRAMGIRDKPTAPASPWQNGFAERRIESIRRECVDHIVVLSEAHLRRILQTYARYYNDIRTHWSLNKDSPVSRSVQRTGNIKSHALLGGLHHQYVRV